MKLCTILTAFAIFASIGPVGAAEPGRNYALLIGVNDYTHLSDLQFCDNDMRALSDAFVQAGFQSKDVTLLHGGAQRKELLPFRNNILQQLKVLLGGLKENDMVVVAFSGHGVHIDGKDYFCAIDTKLDDPAGTMVPAQTVASLLQASKARQKVLIVDACRNDPFPEGTRSASSVQMFRSVAPGDTTSGGFVVMRSCKAEQVSVEDPELGHGVFMNFIINGLLGHADANRDKKVDLLELHQYADYETRNHVRVHRSMLQTPTLALPGGELVGSYVLAKVAARPQKLDVQKVSLVSAAKADPSSFEIKLYDSAYNLFQQGKVNESIVAFEQLLKVAEHEQVREIAGMKLASAYLSVDPVNNISKALKVQGGEGVTVAVLRDTKLMSGEENRGSVKAGQMVRITRISNGWHRVAAINGKVLQSGEVGFIYKTALTPPKPKPAPKPSSTSGRPKTNNSTSNNNYVNTNNYGYGSGGARNGYTQQGVRGVSQQGSGRGLGTIADSIDRRDFRDFDPRDRGIAREADRLLNEADRAERQGKPVIANLKRMAAENRAGQIQQRESIRARRWGGR